MKESAPTILPARSHIGGAACGTRSWHVPLLGQSLREYVQPASHPLDMPLGRRLTVRLPLLQQVSLRLHPTGVVQGDGITLQDGLLANNTKATPAHQEWPPAVPFDGPLDRATDGNLYSTQSLR